MLHATGIILSCFRVNIQYIRKETAQHLMTVENLMGCLIALWSQCHISIGLMNHQTILRQSPQGSSNTWHFNPQRSTDLLYPYSLPAPTEHSYSF